MALVATNRKTNFHRRLSFQYIKFRCSSISQTIASNLAKLVAMLRIGLISDTHGWLDEKVLHHFKNCDEIWHAGDFGSMQVLEQLKALKPLRGVWGNIDDLLIRHTVPEHLVFDAHVMNVAMVHIGGYPGRYPKGVKAWLVEKKPQLFICGHSHIVKAMPDKELGLLHLNPGAAGRQGWHKQRTIMRFVIRDKAVQNLELIELGTR